LLRKQRKTSGGYFFAAPCRFIRATIGQSAWLGLWRGTFICVQWQVTRVISDPTWQTTLRSYEMG